jgi:hypothetical protein
MRHLIKNNIDYFKDMGLIEKRLIIHDNKIDSMDDSIKLLQESFNELEDKKIKNKILFKGQYYDSYSFLLDILNSAKKEIIIIDNYASKELLNILKEIDKKITIVSKNISEILKTKYEKQYNNVTFIKNDSFHDRFIIIDKKELYHSGSSFKDFGKKCFGIHKFIDADILTLILDSLNLNDDDK